MKAKPLIIKADKFAPNGNLLTQDIFRFLSELFRTNPLIQLEDKGYFYTVESSTELANDIVSILENKDTD